MEFIDLLLNGKFYSKGVLFMRKKFVCIWLCLSLLFSASATVFAEEAFKFEKIQGYSILTGEITEISEDRIKLSKISDDLWSDDIGNNNVDSIMLDTTNFEDTEFCKGDVIRAYFVALVDYQIYGLLAYLHKDRENSVDEKAKFLEEIGVLKGYEDGELHLNRNITRAEFTALMVKIYHYSDYKFMCRTKGNDETVLPFKDVPKDYWARDYIEYAYSKGVINGKNRATFAHDESITIRDCIVILLNSSIKNGDQKRLLLNSVKALGGYPDGYLKIAEENELIADQLCDKIATRGEVAVILYNIYNHETNFSYITAGKPVIYLYPQKETDVNVKVTFDGNFTFTYPEYNDGWTVTANSDGTLISGITEYPYLFWEGKVINYSPQVDEGFLVSRKETVPFLEEKLKILGLNEKERADFITYWAPKLIKNEYNIIKFDTEEYASKVSLSIEPQPDSMIRVFMIYKAANGTEKIKEQKLDRVQRKGFIAVEWGGAIEE